ncbi:Glu/Leu/Phe/Val dehydrogenase family protein, partial [Dehalococcoidia bacterium]|nr:Glu/Leu/Phe/Val dehydrogenase family protein [Dehalococcoidia bacterium]
TADDVGTTPDDLRVVMEETQWLVGKPLEVGGSGDSAPATGFGVYQGIRAAAQEIWGHSRLHDRIVAIQGFGKVATSLASYLLQDGARLVVAELYPEARELARNRFGAMIVGPDEIYDVEADIFAPCALGGILNETTIPRLKVGVVAGAANNQLLRKEDGERLDALGILYAPDYLINAGGLINLSEEMGHYSEPEAMAKVAKIYETMERIIALAKMERVSLARMADILAMRRIEETDEKNMGRSGA